MYLTYDEYTSMGGTLDEAVFNSYEFDAESYINEYTFNRLIDDETVSTPVKRCMFVLIKMLTDLSATSVDSISKEVTSQTNDGVSTTYNILPEDVRITNLRTDIQKCIRRYLLDVKNAAGKKILYRGIYPNE